MGRVIAYDTVFAPTQFSIVASNNSIWSRLFSNAPMWLSKWTLPKIISLEIKQNYYISDEGFVTGFVQMDRIELQAGACY